MDVYRKILRDWENGDIDQVDAIKQLTAAGMNADDAERLTDIVLEQDDILKRNR